MKGIPRRSYKPKKYAYYRDLIHFCPSIILDHFIRWGIIKEFGRKLYFKSKPIPWHGIDVVAEEIKEMYRKEVESGATPRERWNVLHLSLCIKDTNDIHYNKDLTILEWFNILLKDGVSLPQAIYVCKYIIGCTFVSITKEKTDFYINAINSPKSTLNNRWKTILTDYLKVLCYDYYILDHEL